MDELRRFNGDEHTKNALLEYLISYFQEKLIERAMKKQSVESLADAIGELKNGFDQLSQDYGLPPKKTTPINQAR